VLLALYRQILGLRRSVASASLLDEVGAESLQHYWFKACVKFWSTAVLASESNALLDLVLRCELELGRVEARSWSGRLRDVLFAMCRVGGVVDGRVRWVDDDAAHQQSALLLGQDEEPCVMDSKLVECWDNAVWARRWDRVAGDPEVLDIPFRAQATYVAYFWMERQRGKRPLPKYLQAGHGLPRCIVKSMARFRLSSHHLRVETARHVRPVLPYAQRLCLRCAHHGVAEPQVDNERHVLLACVSTAALRQDARFSALTFTTMSELLGAQAYKTVALYVHGCMKIVEEALVVPHDDVVDVQMDEGDHVDAEADEEEDEDGFA